MVESEAGFVPSTGFAPWRPTMADLVRRPNWTRLLTQAAHVSCAGDDTVAAAYRMDATR
jgi:hypothetical protein